MLGIAFKSPHNADCAASADLGVAAGSVLEIGALYVRWRQSTPGAVSRSSAYS